MTSAAWSDASFCVLARQLKGFELIRAVHLDPVPFDMDRDLITPTYKKKRPQLLKYYQVRHNFSFTLSVTALGRSILTKLTFVWIACYLSAERHWWHVSEHEVLGSCRLVAARHGESNGPLASDVSKLYVNLAYIMLSCHWINYTNVPQTKKGLHTW